MLTVLHTNDMHNRLTEAKAEELRREKQAAGLGALLLDAGDAVGAGNVTFRPGGEPALELMSDAGYDAMAMGNREFHVTAYGLQCKLFRARFPVLCANITVRNPEALLPVRPYVRLSVAGKTVCVLGLTVPMVTERMVVKHVSAYVFRDPVETARELVPPLRSEADLVICVSHLGIRTDTRLAKTVDGIDLIVGGHSHTPLASGTRIGSTWIVQAAPYARAFGRVEIYTGPDGIECRPTLRSFTG